jgi:hypothetical protein
MILYRRGMGSVEVVNPSGGGSHAAFARRALEASAIGTGLTYDQVAGDLTQTTYSSLRAGKIEFRRLCEQVQYGMLIPMLVRPIADRFHQQGALIGLWGAEVPDGLSHVPPAHEMIDPLCASRVRPSFSFAIRASGSVGLSQSVLESFLPLRARSSRMRSSAFGVSMPLSRAMRVSSSR